MKTFFGKERRFLQAVFRFLAYQWKLLITVLVPLLFLPLVFFEGKVGKCGYVICVMAFYWMTEVLPLAVTSLIPIVMFPVFGILSTDEVCLVYFKETSVMFLGSMIMAMAVEHCNLHKRVALKVLLLIGTSPRRLMLGVMLTTMFLSMWICNAAATALMVPIISAISMELKAHEDNTGNGIKKGSSDSAETTVSIQIDEALGEKMRHKSVTKSKESHSGKPSKEEICCFLGVAYAANIGGTGTITGTATNLTFKGIFESLFPRAEGINFAAWMKFNVPLMLLNTFLAWIWLQIFYLRLFSRETKTTAEQQKRIRGLIAKNHERLGPMSYHEVNVLCLFLLEVILWFFRKPEFVTGWGTLFPEKVVKDATPTIAAVILLFILPAKEHFLGFGENTSKESPRLLSWKVLQEKVPFGLILLLGGGFAISKASEVSGLSHYIGLKLEVIRDFSPIIILTITALAATFITEVSSNTAVANILLPVLAKMSTVTRLHPLYLMLPATVCCSYAFMLPVATPPNAIVMAASNFKTSEMMKAGLGMNLICVFSLIVSFVFLGAPLYGYTSFPDWAENENITAVVEWNRGNALN